MFRHRPIEASPWKNGQVLTDEICLLPERSDRGAFKLRISRATIAAPGLFSAFPGADRTITPVEGTGLALKFHDRTVHLAPLTPYRFDSGLTPDGQPDGGGVRIWSVMATRRVWRMGAAQVLTEATPLAAGPGDLLCLFAAKGDGRVRGGDRTLTLAEGNSLVSSAALGLAPMDRGAVIIVPLSHA